MRSHSKHSGSDDDDEDDDKKKNSVNEKRKVAK